MASFKLPNISMNTKKLPLLQTILAYGVMVTSQILVLLFQVRVLVGQPKQNPLIRAGFVILLHIQINELALQYTSIIS